MPFAAPFATPFGASSDATLLQLLLADVRREGSVPSHGGTGSEDADLIAHLNKAITTVVSKVVECREGFYRRYKDYTISSTTRYRIPSRAIGNRLAAVLLLDGQGKVLRKLDEVSYSNSPSFSNGTEPVGYFLEAGDIVLTPTSTASTAVTLRMVYYIRPGQISSYIDVADGEVFTITGVSGNVLTITSGHGILTTDKVDVLKGGPPFEHLSVDEFPSAVTTTTVTIADASRVEVGDYLCIADRAPTAQIPDAFYPVLVSLTALAFRTALNDSESIARLKEHIFGKDGKGGTLQEAVALIAPRVEEGAKKTMSPYGVLGRLQGLTRRVY